MNTPITRKEIKELPKGYHPNSRKLTEGRKSYKQLKFGRLHG